MTVAENTAILCMCLAVTGCGAATIPVTVESAADCRGAHVLVDAGTQSAATVAVRALADAVGNGDLELTGYEHDVVRALDALEADHLCWLTAEPFDRGRLAHGAEDAVEVDRLLRAACGLTCGAKTQTQPGCTIAVPLKKQAAGFRVGSTVVHLDGSGQTGTVAFVGEGQRIGQPEPISNVARTLGLESFDDSCAKALYDLSKSGQRALSAGQCPVDPVRVTVAACEGTDQWLRLAILRACTAAKLTDDAPRVQIVGLLAGSDDALSWASLIADPESSAQLGRVSMGGVVSTKRAIDHVRLAKVASEVTGPSTPAMNAHLASAFATAPLGVRDMALQRLLAARWPLERRHITRALALKLAVDHAAGGERPALVGSPRLNVLDARPLAGKCRTTFVNLFVTP